VIFSGMIAKLPTTRDATSKRTGPNFMLDAMHGLSTVELMTCAARTQRVLYVLRAISSEDYCSELRSHPNSRRWSISDGRLWRIWLIESQKQSRSNSHSPRLRHRFSGKSRQFLNRKNKYPATPIPRCSRRTLHSGADLERNHCQETQNSRGA